MGESEQNKNRINKKKTNCENIIMHKTDSDKK